jgi:hypothetical protein
MYYNLTAVPFALTGREFNFFEGNRMNTLTEILPRGWSDRLIFILDTRPAVEAILPNITCDAMHVICTPTESIGWMKQLSPSSACDVYVISTVDTFQSLLKFVPLNCTITQVSP